MGITFNPNSPQTVYVQRLEVFANHNDGANQLNRMIRQVNDQFDTQNSKVTANESNITALQSMVTSLQAELAALRKKVDNA